MPRSAKASAHVLFTPGHQEAFVNPERDYRVLTEALAAEGHTPAFVQPDWDRHTPRQWIEQLFRTAEDVSSENPLILAGFSFGALVSLAAAERLQTSARTTRHLGVVAASVSPYFESLYPQVSEKARRALRPEVAAELGALALPDVRYPVQLYVGTREFQLMHDQAAQIMDTLPDVQLELVDEAGHDVLHEAYLPVMVAGVSEMASRLTATDSDQAVA